MKERFVLLLAMGLGLAALAGAEKAKSVAYPEGYRTFYHVKTLVLQPGHALYDAFGGIHHVYANAKALEGLKSGKYPDGAVLVFDLLQTHEEGHALGEGNRKVLAVMERDSKRFAATGGWGFEAFAAGNREKRLVANPQEQCFNCHLSQEKKGYVFSDLRP